MPTRGHTRLTLTVALLLTVASPASAQNVPDDFAITLERSGRSCGAECHDYVVSIDAQGRVTFDGREHVRVRGIATDRIPVEEVLELLATVERIGFFALQDRYREIPLPNGRSIVVSHHLTSVVTVTRNGVSKRVEDSLGAPEALKDLERRIDAVARTRRWVRIDVPTLRQLVADGRLPSEEERADLLQRALGQNELDVVAALLDVGTYPNTRDDGNATPLMWARSAAAVRLLLNAGANVWATDDSHSTALHTAVHLAPEVAAVLLRAGAPIDYPNVHGETALGTAACGGNAGVVTLLLAAAADPAFPVASRVSPLRCATIGRDVERQRSLPAYLGSDPPAFVKDYDGVIAALEEALAKRKTVREATFRRGSGRPVRRRG